jgi:hypothetical protein
MTKDQTAQLIKTAYGYDYRGISITRRSDKSGFSYRYEGANGGGNTFPYNLAMVVNEIDEELASGAVAINYRMHRNQKVGA